MYLRNLPSSAPDLLGSQVAVPLVLYCPVMPFRGSSQDQLYEPCREYFLKFASKFCIKVKYIRILQYLLELGVSLYRSMYDINSKRVLMSFFTLASLAFKSSSFSSRSFSSSSSSPSSSPASSSSSMSLISRSKKDLLLLKFSNKWRISGYLYLFTFLKIRI